MRKVTLIIARAIQAGKSIRTSNTSYDPVSGEVTLFGNRVHELCRELGTGRPSIGRKNFDLVVYQDFNSKPVLASSFINDPVAFPDPNIYDPNS